MKSRDPTIYKTLIKQVEYQRSELRIQYEQACESRSELEKKRGLLDRHVQDYEAAIRTMHEGHGSLDLEQLHSAKYYLSEFREQIGIIAQQHGNIAAVETKLKGELGACSRKLKVLERKCKLAERELEQMQESEALREVEDQWLQNQRWNSGT